MEAKEAPEKLYLLSNGLISYCRNTDEDIEYIRKDTFVEKTEEYMYRQLNEGHMECDDIETFLEKLEEFLDKLEVKEIDFHKELLSFYRHTNDSGSEIALAKHFYELGIKAAQNEHKSCTTDE